MLQCPLCGEQVEPTANQHCPKCDANLSVAMLPPPPEDAVEPFLGFRFYAIAGIYFVGLLLMGLVGVVGTISHLESFNEALGIMLGIMFFGGIGMFFLYPVGGVALIGLAIWIGFTKKRQTLIRCTIAYAVVMVVMASLTLYFFGHCGPACP